MAPPHPPLYLAGQTGSGKSRLAMALAESLGEVEIVNADAYQVYRGMEILTAAPGAQERSRLPHHLYGIIDPSESCDAAAFAKIAREKIGEVGDRGIPLVVGGSGLYLKAITHGLAPTPKGDPELRAELEKESLEHLVRRYEEIDPAGAARTNLKNRRYVTRNLEISLLGGRPASEIKREWAETQPDVRAIYLQRSRKDIYERINRRTAAMFEAGVLDEIAEVGELFTTAAKAIGVDEIRAHLAGKIDRETCLAAIQLRTRRYAKRQESWFRREADFTPVPVEPEESVETIAKRVAALWRA